MGCRRVWGVHRECGGEGGQVCEYDTVPLLLLLWLQTRVEIVRTGGVRVWVWRVHRECGE